MYLLNCPQDSDINNFVFLFAVTDADIGNNGNFRFRITSPVRIYCLRAYSVHLHGAQRV